MYGRLRTSTSFAVCYAGGLFSSAHADSPAGSLHPAGPPPDADMLIEGPYFFSEPRLLHRDQIGLHGGQSRQLQYRHSPPPPPYFDINTPPFGPGAMPPIPGPVFSKAFNALLVLLVIGCVMLGMNLRDSINRMYASEIGEDNEVLTRGGAGNAKWLESIQKTKGVCKGLAPAIDMPTPRGSNKKKKGISSTRRGGGNDDSDDAQEMAPLSSRAHKPKKKERR